MGTVRDIIKIIVQSNTETYQCPECGLHYEDKETAKQCEAWCGQHKSCNLEITKYSVEAAD